MSSEIILIVSASLARDHTLAALQEVGYCDADVARVLAANAVSTPEAL